MTLTRHRIRLTVVTVCPGCGMHRLPDKVVEVLTVEHDDGTAGRLLPYTPPGP